ncbi:DNA repair protein complementing XP-C cells homolog [Malaya genurostris]|uniref:DNA repair protein complementing XP-C cells homolog n=1 Tax=Malaya genurostris TaxID=325434 RepID=UPI0026F3CE84|nr:DNA repair protein complementing XP-C cells homolog [Malaya genurostris]
MNRARRSVTTCKRPAAVKVSDDDFESGGAEDDDFSASEDEWLPGKDRKSKEGSDRGVQDTSLECDDSDEPDDYHTEDSESDGSSVVFKRKDGTKRPSKSSPKHLSKKKRLSPGTRNELYRRTKHFLKNPDPVRPALNSTVSEILAKCQYKKKKEITHARKSKPVLDKTSNGTPNLDDSDSSGDDHLVDPEKLDLNSKFFDHTPVDKKETKQITFDCNAGIKLSDSSSEDENPADNIPASIPKAAANNLISRINESSSGLLNFNDLGEFNRKIEEAKNLLKNYQSNPKDSPECNVNDENVSNLLALGETEAGISPRTKNEVSHQDEDSMNEGSDWEEVQETKKTQNTEKPPDDYQITVEVETSKSKKKRWEEIEMELYIKRQINKVKRDNQLAYHKSSVLCTIAVGLQLNTILNSEKIQAMVLSLMQSKDCFKKGRVDVKFVQQLMKWFKDTFTLKNQVAFITNTLNLKFSLALELFTNKVTCKRDYLLLFLACMRVAGVQSRLVISANAPPKRPAMKDLCPISERQLIEQFEKDYCKKTNLQNVQPQNSSLDKNVDQIKDEFSENDKSSSTLEETPVAEQIPNGSKGVKQLRNSKSSQLNNDQQVAVHVVESCDSKSHEAGQESRKSSAVPKIVVETKTVNSPRRTRSNSRTPIPEKTSTDVSKKIRFSLDPNETKQKSTSTTPSPSSKENAKPPKSIIRRSSPRLSGKLNHTNPPAKRALGTLDIPQLDGMNDVVSTPSSLPLSRRLRSRIKMKPGETEAEADFTNHFNKRANNTPSNKEQNNNQPGRILKRKLFTVAEPTKFHTSANEKQTTVTTNKILSTCSSSESEAGTVESKTSPALNKKQRRPKAKKPSFSDSDDSDFEPAGKKKIKESKTKSARKSLGTSSKKKASVIKDEKSSHIGSAASSSSSKTDMWIEFYSDKDKRWVTVDLFTEKIDCVDYLARHATAPISYVFGFDNQNHVKDITPRYVQHWNTVSRKLRVEPKWLDKTLEPFRADKDDREVNEDAELNKIHIDKPLPTTIAECKNHPLYVLKRHLLRYEALYPVDVPSLGFVRGEAIYARECLFVLQTREKWYKQGRVVKAFETAYKMVKCWKYDKPNNVWLYQPCDTFGVWQTEEYDPPTAENGIVPRNEYGNVELFTPKMLPKKTVHLQLPGLNRVCRRLGIDCAPALTGFEKARMRMVPVYDGFVVCEEFANQVVEEWYKDMEEEEQKEQERYEKRVYGNWKRLIKGVLVRRKLQNKYNFDNL